MKMEMMLQRTGDTVTGQFSVGLGTATIRGTAAGSTLNLEWQWANNWSLKGEFLYMRFESNNDTITGRTVNGINFGVPGRAYQINSEDEAWVARLGVNYRF